MFFINKLLFPATEIECYFLFSVKEYKIETNEIEQGREYNMADIDLFSIIQIADIFFMLAISISYCTVSSTIWGIYSEFLTTWKVSVFGVFLVRIFPNLDWIWSDTEYLSVFSLNEGKYGPEKLWIRTRFTQCHIFCNVTAKYLKRGKYSVYCTR